MEVRRVLDSDYTKKHKASPYYFVFENLDTGEQHCDLRVLSGPLVATRNVTRRVIRDRIHFLSQPIGSLPNTSHIEDIQRVLETVKMSTTFFSCRWKFQLKPVDPQQFTARELLELTGDAAFKCPPVKNGENEWQHYRHWHDKVSSTIFPRFVSRNARNIKKAEQHIEQSIRKIMSIELPKIEKLDELLEALVQIERDYQNKFDQVTAHYEATHTQALETALEAQRTQFEQRLSETERKHQEQLIEMHETIKRLQDMIDKTYQQNELLLEAQKQQASGYESQLFGLLEKLKNES